MPYTPTVWVNDDVPALNGPNQSHAETQYDEAYRDGLVISVVGLGGGIR